MFMDDTSVAQIAPSGAFLGAATFSLNCNNPLWSADERQQFCGQFGLGPNDFSQVLIGRRNVEGGGRQDDVNHESYRFVTGLRGELNDMLSYDAYFLHGETSFLLQDFYNKELADNLMLHLLVEDVDAWHASIARAGLAQRYGVKVSDIVQQPWRMRDFALWDPSGVLWRIAQNV
jgi:hypothetical protein